MPPSTTHDIHVLLRGLARLVRRRTIPGGQGGSCRPPQSTSRGSSRRSAEGTVDALRLVEMWSVPGSG